MTGKGKGSAKGRPVSDERLVKANAPRVPALTKQGGKHAVLAIGAPGEEPSRAVARVVLDPTSLAGSTLARINRDASPEHIDVNAFVAELQDQVRDASAGNLGRCEAMLIAQAHTCDALFHMLTSWALNNAKEGGNAAYFETCMRLAFRAQTLCRTTIETLATIKNPPAVAFVKQFNNAAGPQQVNNNAQTSGARENEITPSKLLEPSNGQRLDIGAAIAAGRANQAMEAVGAVDRAKDGQR